MPATSATAAARPPALLPPDPGLAPEPVLPSDPAGADWLPALPADEAAHLWGLLGEDPDPDRPADPDPCVAPATGPLGEWPPPALLDGTVAGPVLAALAAATDLSSCSDDAVVGLASAASRLQGWAAAVELDATAALVARAGSWRGVTPSGLPVGTRTVAAERICAAELAAALGLSERAAAGRVALALDLHRLPVTRAALTTGGLHLHTARMVVDTLRPLEDATAARVEAAVLPRYAGRCYGDLAKALRRAVLAADPAAAETRRQRGVEDRTVETWALPDGMATAALTGPAEAVETFFTFATAGADAATGPGDARSIDQRRFDFLADLAHAGLTHDTTRPDLLTQPGPAGAEDVGAAPRGVKLPTRQGRRPQIQVVVSAETLLGICDAPGELSGYGPITAQVARRIAAEGTWQRLLTEPRTGRFDELSVDAYEPPQDMRDHVIARDPVCIGAGCRLPANRCDLDHRIEYPRGPTAAPNLDPWCRSGHEIKTFTDTTVTLAPDSDSGSDRGAGGDGTRIVTYPTGRSYRLPADPILDDFGLGDASPVLEGDASPDPMTADPDEPPF
jgi:hypothetical protein